MILISQYIYIYNDINISIYQYIYNDDINISIYQYIYIHHYIIYTWVSLLMGSFQSQMPGVLLHPLAL